MGNIVNPFKKPSSSSIGAPPPPYSLEPPAAGNPSPASFKRCCCLSAGPETVPPPLYSGTPGPAPPYSILPSVVVYTNQPNPIGLYDLSQYDPELALQLLEEQIRMEEFYRRMEQRNEAECQCCVFWSTCGCLPMLLLPFL